MTIESNNTYTSDLGIFYAFIIILECIPTCENSFL